MKKLIIIIIVLLLSPQLYAADQKTTALTALTDVADGDIMYIVDGATTSKKITVSYRHVSINQNGLFLHLLSFNNIGHPHFFASLRL